MIWRDMCYTPRFSLSYRGNTHAETKRPPAVRNTHTSPNNTNLPITIAMKINAVALRGNPESNWNPGDGAGNP